RPKRRRAPAHTQKRAALAGHRSARHDIRRRSGAALGGNGAKNMSEFGVTKTGFLIKPLQQILDDKAARARDMFGDDVDLRSTSTLRKLLDIASAEDQELWKRMEQLYYSNFISTASGDALDLLGDDLGIKRRFLLATGQVKLTLSGEASGRIYNFPIGTL